MALDRSALLEVLDALKAADVDERIRQAATTIYQALIEAELSSVIGAGPHERTETRLAQRNGHRPKTVSTAAGDLELQIAIDGTKLTANASRDANRTAAELAEQILAADGSGHEAWPHDRSTTRRNPCACGLSDGDPEQPSDDLAGLAHPVSQIEGDRVLRCDRDRGTTAKMTSTVKPVHRPLLRLPWMMSQ